MKNPEQMQIFGHWQDGRLILPSQLRLAECEAVNWSQFTFPAEKKEVTVDASALIQVDSIGVAALVLLARRAYAEGVTLYWQGIGGTLSRLLAVYELDEGVFLTCRNS